LKIPLLVVGRDSIANENRRTCLFAHQLFKGSGSRSSML
jgi:hypothetical protein